MASQSRRHLLLIEPALFAILAASDGSVALMASLPGKEWLRAALDEDEGPG